MHARTPTVLLLPVLLAAACSSSPGTPEKTQGDGISAAPAEAELVERGKYLVEIMGCHDCHSPKLMGPEGPYPDPDRLLSGFRSDGQLPPVPETPGWALFNMDLTASVGPWGINHAANITSDDTGIGTWTEEQFAKALTQGWYKGQEGGRRLLPPMPWQNYRNMKADDVKAVFAYLKSTKPVSNVVPPPVPPKAS